MQPEPSIRRGIEAINALDQYCHSPMGSPLIVRLLLDAQDAFGQLVDRVEGLDASPHQGLNDPAWVVAHTSFFHDCWLNGDAQGLPKDRWDRWLVHWADLQREARPSPVPADLGDASQAWQRIAPRAGAFVRSLRDEDLETVPAYEEGAWPAGTTVGYLVARAIAHLFAHASELNVIATAAGLPDAGLPGPLAATRST